jgi:hypothetical protein
MLCLVDEHVPTDVSRPLKELGFEVEFSREVLGAAAADKVLAQWADSNSAVVVTCNCKHFEGYISRRPSDNQQKFRRAGAIFVKCKETRLAARLTSFSSVLRAELKTLSERPDKRLIVSVCEHQVTLHR